MLDIFLQKILNGDREKFEFQGMAFQAKWINHIILTAILDEADEIEIPDGVTEIADYAFERSSIKSVKFPNSLKIIGHKAFSGCKNLENLKFGKNPFKIGDSAFSYCLNLESVNLRKVSVIGDSAFNFCINLQNVKINKGLSRIESRAFYGCKKLKEIALPSTVKDFGLCGMRNVNNLFLSGNSIPSNVVYSVLWEEVSGKDAGLIIHIGGKVVIIPKSVDLSEYKSVMSRIENFNPDTDKSVSMYDCAASTENKQTIALEGFSLIPDPETRDFLIQSFPEIIARTKNEDEFFSCLHKYRDLNLMTESLEMQAVFAAQEKDWPQTAAFLMKEIQKEKKKDFNPYLSFAL